MTTRIRPRVLALFTLCAAAALLAPLVTSAPMRAADLSAADKTFLTTYTRVHDALAADDLAGAKQAAGTLAGDADAQALAKAANLKAAREAFAKLSVKAEPLAQGQPGYHVFNCPMVHRDWVQTSDKVANPYEGKAMLDCGVEKK